MRGPNYKAKIDEFNRKNAREVVNGLSEQTLAKTVEHMITMGVDEPGQEEFLNFLGSGTGVAKTVLLLHYAKSPKRQNVYEKAFIEYAEQVLPPDLKIGPLPNKGKNAFYPLGGEVVGAKECPKGGLLPKSFDFLVQGKAGRVLIATKYTEDEGGAQDNQFRDLINICSESLGMHGDTAVLLIADGPYYDRPVSDNPNLSRINFLRQLTENDPQVFAGRGYELVEMIEACRHVLDNGGAK
jgi:hypothetical protein